MSIAASRMALESRQSATAVADLLAAEAPAFAALAQALRAQPPASLLTVARGSSDHAAQYMGYLVMARLGRLVASLPMSLVTLYQARIHCDGLVAFAFSQSGQSPDLLAPLQVLSAQGARTVAFVNDAASPLALAAQHLIALHAGPELSVAATKSCIAQLAAGAALVAAWQRDRAFDRALQALPEALEEAARLDWTAALPGLASAEHLYVVARGTGLAVAHEVALKLKEVCGLHAEAYSSAELQHGPMALVAPDFALLVLAPDGPAQPGLLTLTEELRARGAPVWLAAPPGTPGAQLPLLRSGSADLDPICALQSAYVMVEALARARGLDPDRPRHLNKVTLTR